MAKYRFFIQSVNTYDTDKLTGKLDIEKTFKCYYVSFTGLGEDGDAANVYTESFPESSKPNIYTPNPSELVHSSTECKLTLLWKSNKDYAVQQNERKFQDYVFGRELVYYDTFRKRYFHLLMTKAPTKGEEKLYGGNQYREVTYTFTNLRGTSYPDNILLNYDIELELTTDGKDLYLATSRKLSDTEFICLESHGITRGVYSNGNGWYKNGGWHFCRFQDMKNEAISVAKNGKLTFNVKMLDNENRERGWFTDNTRGWHVIKINKTSDRSLILPHEKGVRGMVTFGIAVYNFDGERRPIKKSATAFFRTNMLVNDDFTLKTWYTT